MKLKDIEQEVIEDVQAELLEDKRIEIKSLYLELQASKKVTNALQRKYDALLEEEI